MQFNVKNTGIFSILPTKEKKKKRKRKRKKEKRKKGLSTTTGNFLKFQIQFQC